MTIDEINQKFHAENTCALKETATQPVFGDGPSDARIVIIGEAPGANEDKTGVPFIGRAGQILESFLSEAGLSRQDIYITNTVKYRPPKNREPKPEEKSACLPWLSAELAIINPHVVITLGQHALQTFNNHFSSVPPCCNYL
jgi:uracil-DNA glycosylase family 4